MDKILMSILDVFLIIGGFVWMMVTFTAAYEFFSYRVKEWVKRRKLKRMDF